MAVTDDGQSFAVLDERGRDSSVGCDHSGHLWSVELLEHVGSRPDRVGEASLNREYLIVEVGDLVVREDALKVAQCRFDGVTG